MHKVQGGVSIVSFFKHLFYLTFVYVNNHGQFCFFIHIINFVVHKVKCFVVVCCSFYRGM